MKKKFLAVVMALVMLLSLLTGCGKKESDYFYEMVDEILALEDVEVNLTMPYHGAKLSVSGFVSRSERKADLELYISGTEYNDGVLTELRIEGSQIWLNVRQLAETVLEFDLNEYYREDIQLFYEQQFADWMIYEADENFWNGVPGWGALLTELWKDTRSDISSYITGQEGQTELVMDEKQTGTVLQKMGSRVMNELNAYEEGFLTFADQESEFFKTVQLEAVDQFETWAADLETWLEEYSSGEAAVSGAKVTLTKDDNCYILLLEQDNGDTWELLVSAAEADEIERPLSVMEFEAYGDTAFYLVTFSNSYVGKTLSGEEMDAAMEQAYAAEREETYYREDMTTGTVAGYDDLASIQFIPEGGYEMTVPILPNFLGNTVTVADRGAPYLADLSLEGSGWKQYVSSQESLDKNPQFFLEDHVYNYYDTFINMSGFQLVQDLSEMGKATGGSAYTQGFIYRDDNYSDPIAMIFVLIPQDGCDSYVLMELNVELAVISETEMAAVQHLFESLGLECPVDLTLF